MPKDHRLSLGVLRMFLLPFLRILDTKSSAENLPNSLQWHAFALGVEEYDEQPTNEADSSVKSESSTRRPALHH